MPVCHKKLNIVAVNRLLPGKQKLRITEPDRAIKGKGYFPPQHLRAVRGSNYPISGSCTVCMLCYVFTRQGRETAGVFTVRKADLNLTPFSRKVATQPAIFQSPLINALSSAPYHVTQSLHRQRSALVAPVNHCMAVRAQWDQLCYRVDLVSLAQCCQRPDVMHMNKSPPLFAICFFKIKSAALADSPVMPDTYPSRFRVPFIGIYRDLSLCTLNIASGNGEFFRKGVCRKIGIPYGSLFSQKPVIETAFKVLNDCNGRIVWMRRVDHIKGEGVRLENGNYPTLRLYFVQQWRRMRDQQFINRDSFLLKRLNGSFYINRIPECYRRRM